DCSDDTSPGEETGFKVFDLKESRVLSLKSGVGGSIFSRFALKSWGFLIHYRCYCSPGLDTRGPNLGRPENGRPYRSQRLRTQDSRLQTPFIFAEDGSELVANLAQGRVCFHSLDNKGHQVLVRSGSLLDPLERLTDERFRPPGPNLPEAFDLLQLQSWINLEDRDCSFAIAGEPVDTHNCLIAGFDGPLVFIRSTLDLTLYVPCLNRSQHSAHLVDLADVIGRDPFYLVRQLFDRVRAAERVCRAGDARFVCDHLLGSQRNAGGMFGGQSQRLVHRIGMQRLGSAQYRGQRLDGSPNDVDFRLLSGQCRAAGLGMKSQSHGARISCAEAVPHYAGPHPPCCAELCDFLEKLIVRIEEKGKARSKVIYVEPAVPRGLNIGYGITQRERYLLGRCGSCLTYVVARDRYCIPARQLARRKCE